MADFNHTDFEEMRYCESDWFNTFTLGHEDPGTRNWLDDFEENIKCNTGWTADSVEYFINDWRYRDKLVPGASISAAFGCSYTFGYGVDNPWPCTLDAVNCGINGASNDLIARLAISYCKTFKPSSIYVLWTFPWRREHVHDNNGLHKWGRLSDDKIKEELKNPSWVGSYLTLMNDHADLYNFQKNKLLLSTFCDSNSITLNQSTIFDLPKGSFPLARDGDHPGPDWHDAIANSFS